MASINCAHCKGKHSSVAEVRACASGSVPAGTAQPANGGYKRTELPPATGDSTLVKRIKAARDLVPSGHYAVAEMYGRAWRFFKVDKPETGQWRGYTFLKEQAGSDYYRVKPFPREVDVMEAIAKDPRAAAIDYGRQLGRCSVCNRELTNPESIDAGIGPICAGKRGW